ncbi:MAG: outer membrane protein assembly factor BamA [Pseudomonadota bacterium]
MRLYKIIRHLNIPLFLFIGLSLFLQGNIRAQVIGYAIGEISVQSDNEESKKRVYEYIITNIQEDYDSSLFNKLIKQTIKENNINNLILSAACSTTEKTCNLNFKVVEKEQIVELIINGNALFNDKQFLSMLSIKKGMYIDDLDLDEAINNALDKYREQGYFKTNIQFELKQRENTFGRLLVFNINEGNQAIIKTVNLNGFLGLETNKILKKLSLKENEPLDPKNLKLKIDGLVRYYKEKGYYRVRVFNPIYETYTDSSYVTIFISAKMGYKIKSDFSGDKGFKEEELMSELNFESIVVDDPKFVELLKRGLTAFYNSNGYFNPQITIESNLKGNDLIIDFDIEKGPVATIKEFNIIGASQLTKKAVDKIVEEKMGKSKDKYYYKEKMLKYICPDIEAIYNRMGYLDASCEILNIVQDKENETGSFNININEGVKTTITKINLTGLHSYSKKEIEELIKNKVDTSINLEELENDKRLILRKYLSSGYIDCKVVEKLNFSDDKTAVQVDFNILEGEKALVGDINIEGNFRTNDRIIRRKIELEYGDPLNPDLLFQTKRNIESLGVFKRVSIIDKGKGKYSNYHDLLIKVEESNAINLELGGGVGSFYDADNTIFKDNFVRGFALVRHNNFFGGAESLYLRSEIRRRIVDADLTERSISVGYREPDIWNTGYNFNVDYLNKTEDEIAYDSDENKVTFKIDKKYKNILNTALKYAFEVSETFNILSEDIEARQYIMGSIGPIITLDLRDSRFRPTSGYFGSIYYELYNQYLASAEEFHKSMIRNDFFLPFLKPLLLAFSLRAGFANPYSDTSELPIDKRFFLGGTGSVRGFSEDFVGSSQTFGIDEITGELEPIGGNIFLNYMTEVMIPVFSDFYFAVFADGGNVYADFDDFDITSFRKSAGLGIRYFTPIGPIKLDYGFKLDKQDNESLGNFHFSMGIF